MTHVFESEYAQIVKLGYNGIQVTAIFCRENGLMLSRLSLIEKYIRSNNIYRLSRTA